MAMVDVDIARHHSSAMSLLAKIITMRQVLSSLI
jgi:hypothetical protein